MIGQNKLIRNLLYKNQNYKKIKKDCKFCKGAQIQILSLSFLYKHVNPMLQIKNRMYNQICYKHQRKIRQAIIIAREMHLINYIELRI